MSAFEISVTPTRLKTAKKRNEAKEPITVMLAPFSAKATVTFENVPVTKFARRILNVVNPSDEEVQLFVTKGLSPEYNISLEWTKVVVPPNNQVQMEISWNPLTEVCCKETLQFTDSRNFKKDVAIILKSIKNKVTKNVKRFPNISSGPTLKLKSPTGAKSSQQKTSKRQGINKVKPSPRKSGNILSLGSRATFKSTVATFERSSTSQGRVSRSQRGKENISPVTPANASKLFDKIEFTPVLDITSKSPTDLDYLASLPTPVNRNQGESLKPENLIYSVQPRRLCVISSPDECIPKPLSQLNSLKGGHAKKRPLPKIVVDPINSPEKNKIELKENEFEPKICSTTTKRSCLENSENADTSEEVRRKLYESQIINKTFELNEKKTEDNIEFPQPNVGNRSNEVVLNVTTTLPSAIPRSLSIIEEEQRTNEPEESIYMPLQKTVTLGSVDPDKDLKRDVELVLTPLKKQFESMNDLSAATSKRQHLAIKGSMPNLNDLETINHIEQNRYFHRDQQDLDKSDASNTSATSTISTVELVFNHNEILAQSSRYNLHEIDTKSMKKTPKKTPSPSERYYQSPSPGAIKNRALSPLLTKLDQTKENKCRVANLEQMKRSRDEPNDSPTLLEPPSNRIYEMSISPPKRTKIDPDQSSSRSLSSRTSYQNRSMRWSKTQPKNIKLQKTLTLLKKSLTPRKVKTEPRIMLYDSSTYLQSCINPDPFAATTTCDPFLAATMYLDERCVQKHEIQFKKWLNALVTIPADFDPDCNQKVDVGRLFNEVRNKELTLAPTKQEQCINYLTKSRMDFLRRAAVRLFMSEEMRVPCSKVAVSIKKQSIRIRSDRDLHLDVVMQRQILELLLNFNPLWLRIGLEVVFGEIVHLNSNADIIGLSTFIINRLFRDKPLEQKHSRAYSLSEEYSEYIKKFTLQKFLFLLLFLDSAKNKKIMKYNPCLFVKRSQYKETKEILLRFSSELLANVGDITRDLRRVGYVLTHKQCFLDEFDYAFNNLAVDLRDGIRLTRIMEIILLRDDLSKKLRVPAISRLQRIFNVNLGLKALAGADFALSGNILSADIVDGHREKTLSLLWQIIYKFRAPKFNAAAKVIQTWWRKSWLKVVIKRRIRRKIEMQRNAAATVIQSAFRGYIARRYAQVYKWERAKAVMCLQKYVRGYIARKRFAKVTASIVCIQRWYRETKKSNEIRMKFLYLRQCAMVIQCWYRRRIFARKLKQAAPIIRELKDAAKRRHEKSIIIQRAWKSYTIRNKFRSMVEGIIRFNNKRRVKNQKAAKIQAFFRMIPLRRDFLAKRRAARIIQKRWKSYALAKTIRLEFLAIRTAAITIQRGVRAWLAMKKDRHEYLELKKATLVVQRRFRANKLAQESRSQFLKYLEVTINVQRRFRANKARNTARSEYLKLKSTVIMIQQRFRAQMLMKREREGFLTLRNSVIKIQIKLRARLHARNVGKITRLEFLAIRTSTITIQRGVRAWLAMKKDRQKYLELKNATLVVQNRFRANKLAQETRSQFLKYREVTINVQRRFRANKARNTTRSEYLKLKSTVIMIQQRFRAQMLMKREREGFLTLRNSVIKIQKKLRARLHARNVGKVTRLEFLAIRTATITIQRGVRAWLAMKKDRQRYLELKKAALMVQNRFRANKLAQEARSQFLKYREVTINVQRRFRANKARNIARLEYLKLKSTAIIIQQRFRAQLLMKKERRGYLTFRSNVIKIQIKLRATLLARNVRLEFLKVQYHTILIQQRFRANQLMRKERSEFLRLKACVISIQRRFVANNLSKIHRNEFLKIKAAVIIMQRKIRARTAMKHQREQYLALRQSTINVQRMFRSKMEMISVRKQFIELRNATLFIQRFYRSKKLMQKDRTDYQHFKCCTIKIQRWYRARLEGKRVRQRFVALKSAAVIVQRRFRAQLAMKLQVAMYEDTRYKVVIIQRHIRSYLLAKRERKRFLSLKAAAIVIQRQYTKLRLMRHERKILESTKTIQMYWRATVKMRRERGKFLLMKKSAIVIQRSFRSYLLMKKERTEFLQLRAATIFVQQKFRSCRLTESLRQRFIEKRRVIAGLQNHIRGYLARSRFNAMMTPEMRDMIRRRRAAVIIQRYWRGHRIRSKRQNLKMRVIRRKIMELKRNSQPRNAIKYKISGWVSSLKGRFNIVEALTVLVRIENISRTVPQTLTEYTKFVGTFCYAIMAQAIRSEADKQIIELCSRIILNLARYDTCNSVEAFQENGLVTVAQMLLRWCDKDCAIFNTLCTLIWVFAHSPEKKQKIREFMTTPEALYMVRETKKLVLRKENMRKNVRKPSMPLTKQSSPSNQRKYPCLNPDFGVVKTSPYIFNCSVFAFDSVLAKLEINSV